MLSHFNDNYFKKHIKKWKKVRAKLKNDGIDIIDEKSCYITIANAGLGNGISLDQLTNLLLPFGDIDDIKSYYDKSYAFVSFTSEEAADKCIQTLQGSTLKNETEERNCFLFLYFINSLPNLIVEEKTTSFDSNNLPNGLIKIEDFISEEEEIQLIEKIEADIQTTSQIHIQEDLKQRSVLHYGYKFRYGTNDVDCLRPLSGDGLPDFVKNLLDKMMESGYISIRPDQLTINKYSPGNGIPPHIDNPDAFGSELATVSLGSQIVMDMKSSKGLKVSILLQPRTLVVFTGESRYSWTHGIAAKKNDIVFDELNHEPHIMKRATRISLTFRKVLSTPKHCLPSDHQEAAQLEKNLVHNVYSNIACHFSSTRDKPWPRVVEFLKSLEPGSNVLDVGCGSGRYLNVCSDIFIQGCDYCSSLASVCSSKNSPVFVCDGLNIPVRTGYFDASICIAVIHHYSTFERRVASIKELLRIIRRNGLILIYVWAAEQKLHNIKSSYLKPKLDNEKYGDETKFEMASSNELKSLEGRKQPLVIHKNRTEFVEQDCLVPWTTKQLKTKDENNLAENTSLSSTYYRYYHVFKENELESLCSSISDCRVVNSSYDNGNWRVILQKC